MRKFQKRIQVANEKVSNNNTKVNRGGAIVTSNRSAKPQQQRQQQRVQTQQSKQQSNARGTAVKALGTKIRSAAGGYRQPKQQRRLNTVKSVHVKSDIRNIAAHPSKPTRSGVVNRSDKKEDSGDWI